MLRRQFERRDAPEGPPHDPQVTPETPSCQFIRYGLEQGIRIVNKIRQCWNPAAHSIPSVIGNHEVQLFFIVERGNLIVVTDHLPIAVEKQDPGPLLMTCVKTAQNRNVVFNRDREIEGILRAFCGVSARVKNIS